LLLLTPIAVSAQSYATQGADRYLRLEWEATSGRRGPVVAGYVYNTGSYTVDRVQLAIDAVDGSGQVTASKIGYVVGTVPSGTRSYFEILAPAAATMYRVRVLSFDPVGRSLLEELG
jgi:hypothetical protein